MINSIRKKADQDLVGALVKFHYRRVDRLKNEYRKGRVEKTDPHSADYPLTPLRGLLYGLLRGLLYGLVRGLPCGLP